MVGSNFSSTCPRGEIVTIVTRGIDLAKNYRSLGLLRKLGFLPTSAEQQAQHQDEADELVMVKPALGAGDTA